MADKSTVEISGDTGSLDDALDRSQSAFESFGRGVESVAAEVKATWDSVVETITGTLREDFAAVTRYVGALFDEMWARITAGSKSFIEKQQDVARMGSVIKATGDAAGYTADQLEKINKGMQGVSTYGSKAIRAAQTALLEYRNIKGDIFVQALYAAQNLAAITGGDLTSAVRDFGRVLNDPIKGLHDLQESGVKFSQAEVDMINKMIKTNDVIGVQRVILDKLGALMGGAAKAQADTFGGQIERLNNVLDDVFESIGSLLVPVLTEKLIPAAQAAAKIVSYAVEQISKQGTNIGDYWNQGVTIAIEWLNKLADAAVVGFSYVQTAVENFGDFFDMTWKKVQAVSLQALAFVLDLVLDWAQKAVDAIPVVIDMFQELWDKAIEYGKTALGALKDGWDIFADYFGKVLNNMWENFQDWWTIIKGKMAGADGLKFVWVPLVDGFKDALDDIEGIAGGEKKVNVRDKLGIDDDVDKMRDDAKDLLAGAEDPANRFDKALGDNIEKNRKRLTDFKDLMKKIIGGEETPGEAKPKGPFEFGAGDEDKDKGDRGSRGAFEDLISLNKRIQGAALGGSPEEKAIKEQTGILKNFASTNMQQGKQLIDALDPAKKKGAVVFDEDRGMPVLV